MINVYEFLKEQKEMKLKGNLYYMTQINFAYNTNHIEGSKLTEEQTRYIYETNTFVTTEENSVTRIDDIIETLNHFKLFDYMLDVANNELTEEIIKEFHKILKSGTSDEKKSWFKVSAYKALANEVGGNFTTKPEEVEKEINALLKWYNSLSNLTIEDIIKLHSEFERIHPFQDGNGRVGRIIMFKECLKNNIVPFIILEKDKMFYYRGLQEYQNGGEKGYLIDTCLNAQDQYKKIIEKFLGN